MLPYQMDLNGNYYSYYFLDNVFLLNKWETLPIHKEVLVKFLLSILLFSLLVLPVIYSGNIIKTFFVVVS